MSATDASYADAAFARLPPRPPTKGERAAARADRDRREFGRLVETIRRRMSLQANVTRPEILSEGFSEAYLDGNFARAARRAGAHRMAG